MHETEMLGSDSEHANPEDGRRHGGRLRRLLQVLLAALGLVVLVGVGFYAVLAFTEGDKAPGRKLFAQTPRRPLVMAHRGGAGLGPENTMEVLRKAQGLGVDVLEIDIRTTADGEFAVIHDSKVDRTTDGSGAVAEMTLKDLQSLDAGHDFSMDGGATFPYRGQGIRVPTLTEVLRTFPSSNINIEAKQIAADFAEPLCSTVRAGAGPDNILIASVSGEFIERFRQVCPEFPTSASFIEVTKFLSYQKIGVAQSFSPSMNAMQVPVRLPAVDIVTEDFVTSARERGLEVHAWTVNDEERMRELIRMGVGGIITDRPDLLLSILADSPR